MPDAETVLCWRCPCGTYALRVVGPWCGALDVFLAQAERHQAGCDGCEKRA